jgi:hypothetical protein
VEDAETPDAEIEDAGVEDAEVPDAEIEDASPPDVDVEEPPMLGEDDRVVAGNRGNTVLHGNQNGGDRYEEICPAGEVLIGFAGEVRGGASYLGQLRAICGGVRFTPNGPTTQNGMAFPVRGRFGGGGAFNLTCPIGGAVSGYGGRFGALVDQFYVRCARLETDGQQVTAGDVEALAPGGGQGGNAVPDVDCPNDTLAVGAVIRAGDGIDAVGLICAPLNIAP